MSDAARSNWSRLNDAELGSRLRRLRDEVDFPDIDLVDRVTDQLGPMRRRPDRRNLAIAAALIALAGVMALSFTSVRTAVADWLGIGGTSIGVVAKLPPADSIPAPSGPPPGSVSGVDAIRQAAYSAWGVEIALPDPALVGDEAGWEIRTIDSTRDLVVAWEHFTITFRGDSGFEPRRKFVTTTEVVSSALLTDENPALWIEGPHIRVTGSQVELAGNTLLWVHDGIEYRISGEIDRESALEIAVSMS